MDTKNYLWFSTGNFLEFGVFYQLIIYLKEKIIPC